MLVCLPEQDRRDCMTPMIRKAMGATLAAVTLAGAMATFSTDASAQYYRHHNNNGGAVAAGVVGGLALGALAAGAANGGYGGGYGYGPGYAAPVYGSGYGGCEIHYRRAWDGYRWVRERVRECY
jgi:hypothetical protein